jgi:hypothetical protein
VTYITGAPANLRDKGTDGKVTSKPKEIAMRQFIIATVALIVLTAASSILAVRGHLQPVGQCGPLVAYSPCRG